MSPPATFSFQTFNTLRLPIDQWGGVVLGAAGPAGASAAGRRPRGATPQCRRHPTDGRVGPPAAGGSQYFGGGQRRGTDLHRWGGWRAPGQSPDPDGRRRGVRGTGPGPRHAFVDHRRPNGRLKQKEVILIKAQEDHLDGAAGRGDEAAEEAAKRNGEEPGGRIAEGREVRRRHHRIPRTTAAAAIAITVGGQRWEVRAEEGDEPEGPATRGTRTVGRIPPAPAPPPHVGPFDTVT